MAVVMAAVPNSRRRRPDQEPVTVGVESEPGDEPFVKGSRVRDGVPQPEVDVLCQSGIVSESYLQRHPAFHDPSSRLSDFKPGDDSFEHNPSAQPVEADARLVRLGEKPVFQSGAERLR